MADMRRHTPHLPVLPLDEHELDPAGWDTRAEPYRRRARPEVRRGLYASRPRGPGDEVAEIDAAAQALEGNVVNVAFDLHEVGFRPLVSWVGNRRLERSVVGEKDQPLAVRIEASRRVYPGERDEVAEACALVAEAADDTIRLVKQDDA
jgi:hypothetical protein